jgi:plastocyanin domain-containing protein
MKLIFLPTSFSLMFSAFSGHAADTKSGPDTSGKVVEMKITSKGFEPGTLPVEAGIPITLKVTRETDQTCAKDIAVPKLNVKKEIPLNKPVYVELGKFEKGQEVSFTCGMNMMKGKVIVQ